MILLAYVFESPTPGPEIIAMLRRVELACFGGVGEEGGAPALKASCGETLGMAYWGEESGWDVGDGRAVASVNGFRVTRPVSGDQMTFDVSGPVRELNFEGGQAWSNSGEALLAFGGGVGSPMKTE